MSISDYIKGARKAAKLSLREAAAQVGVDPSYFSRVESGKVRPSQHLLEKLAPVLKCSVDEIAVMAGLLPPRVRTAVERSGAVPADALREIGAYYVKESKATYDVAALRAKEFVVIKRKRKPAGIAHEDGNALALFLEDSENPEQQIEADSCVARAKGKDASQARHVDSRNKLNALTSTEWIPETVSVWTQRGLGAGHEDAQIERQHPAPFSFTDVARLVRFFSKPGDAVLDPFVGVGSTLKACATEGRRGLGIELNPRYADLARERLRKEVHLSANEIKPQLVIEGDSRAVLGTLDTDSIDFVVTSPPYWNILHKEDHKAKQERSAHKLDTRYSDDSRDLGNVSDYTAFLDELSGILGQCGRVLKAKKYMAVVVSDFRDKSRFVMFHADLARSLEHYKLHVRGIKILYQRHKKIFPYGYPYAYVPNIHHQYILILQNER